MTAYKHFSELAHIMAGIDMVGGNYVTVTLCIPHA